jgi:uncharacterized protein
MYLAVVAAGFVAGFINTLAGSGSVVTLPLLIYIGLPANVANATNRVGVLLQSVVAVGSFRRQKKLEFKNGVILTVPAVVGAIIGARIAVDLNEEIMRLTIGIMMVVMLILILFQPERWLREASEPVAHAVGSRTMIAQVILFFLIGLYGGFIQLGVGVFLLAGLVLGAGYDLIRANAIKLLIILCFTAAAMGVFIYNDQVDWPIGLTLAVGSMLGAWVATHTAVKGGAKFVRWLLIGVVTFSAAELLGLFHFAASQFSNG